MTTAQNRDTTETTEGQGEGRREERRGEERRGEEEERRGEERRGEERRGEREREEKRHEKGEEARKKRMREELRSDEKWCTLKKHKQSRSIGKKWLLHVDRFLLAFQWSVWRWVWQMCRIASTA